MTLRFKLPPGGDVPPIVAARRLGLSLEAFNSQLELLISRGFPAADPTTGNYDLDAIDVWRRRRNPQLFGNDSPSGPRLVNKETIRERLVRAGGG